MSVNTTNIKFNLMYDTSVSTNNRWCYVYRATSGGTSFSSNLAGTAAFDYFPNTPTTNDALYIGFRTGSNPSTYLNKWRDITLQVGTALNGTPTLAWEYYNGSAWTTLTVTNGSAMQTTGTQTITFKPPVDWYAINPTNGGAPTDAASGLFVRCRMSATTGVTEGGANATTPVRIGSNAFHVVDNIAGTEVTPEDLYDTAIDQSWDCDPYELHDNSSSNKIYFFNCNLEVGQQTFHTGGTKSGFFDFKDQSIMFENDCRPHSSNSANRIVAGNSESSITGSYSASVFTNQTFLNRCLFNLGGILNLYGFTWEHKYLGSQVTSSTWNNTWDLTSAGFNTSSANGSAIIDCKFSGFRFCYLYTSTNDGVLKNTKIMRCNGGGILGGSVIENVTVTNCNSGVRSITSNSPTLYDCAIVNTNYKFSTFGLTGTIRARNFKNLDDLSTSNAVTWFSNNTGFVYVQNSVDVKVVDQTGTPINGATVVLTPNGTSEHENNFSESTDSNGDITTQYVTVKLVEPSTTVGNTNTSVITDYNDFTLTINASGYQEQIIIYEMSEKTKLVVSLLPEISSGGGVGGLNLADDLIRV